MAKDRIIIICTSAAKLGDAPTGCWLEELASPYYAFKDAGYAITIASPKGGKIPFDPASVEDPKFLTDTAKQFLNDTEAKEAVSNSLHTAQLQNIESYDGVFVPGGHGAVVDLPHDPNVQKILVDAATNAKLIASVCHGPAAFTTVKLPSGDWLVKGRKVTAFSNSEEKSVGKEKLVPFLLQSKLEEEGALYSKADDWQPHVVSDGLLVTGQNPASSKGVGEAAVKVLQQAKAPPLK